MLSYFTFSLFYYVYEIKSDVYLDHDDKAFSYYASEKVMKLLKEDNKEFNTVIGVKYYGLYDGGGKNLIFFDKFVSV